MKTIILLLIMAVSSIFAVNAQTNLITDGDFELGDLSGWTIVNDVKRETNFPINGTGSARMTGAASADREVKQEITVEGGSTYELKFTARITEKVGAEGVNTNGGELYALIQIGEETDTILTFTENTNTTKTVTFDVPSGKTKVTVNFMKNKNIVYLDDVSVVKVEKTSLQSIENSKLKAYSPHSGSLTLNSERTIEKLSIYSLNGKIIHSIMVNSNETSINQLKSGICILKIYYTDGRNDTLKMMVK